MADMTATLGALSLPNPVLTASGCAAAGRELHQFFDVAQLGAVVTKSIMTRPRSGRATPRMAETPSGMLNSIGHGCSLIHTLLGMDIDTDTMAPALGGVTGGLSGPAIRPVAIRCVWQVKRAIPHLPILGMGGIRSGLDALQFILAGASAVSVGTAVFGDPNAPIRILRELEQALDERGIASLSEAVGKAHYAP